MPNYWMKLWWMPYRTWIYKTFQCLKNYKEKPSYAFTGQEGKLYFIKQTKSIT